MTEPISSRFPEPLDDDDDDVAWALQTAKVQWNRGAQADAIVWLRRAADSADQLGNVWRAADLRRIADQLSATFGGEQAPMSHVPGSVGASDVDELLDNPEDSGVVTSIPPPIAPPPRLSSYAPVDDLEVEDIAEEFDEDVLVDDEAESAEPIADDALELEAYGHDDPVTQPLLGDSRFGGQPRRSPPPPPAPSRMPRFDSSPEIEIEPEPESEPDPGTAPALELELELEPEPEGEPRLGDVLLGEVRGLEDVPPEGQALLAREAVIQRLAVHEEISSFGLALVLRGAVQVMPAITDLSCARVAKGEIVWSQGNLEDGIALRLVAAEDETEVAVWDANLLTSTVRDYPWVVEDLKNLADRFQALAGVSMGPMGERLDDSLRAMVTERCEIKRLLPGEALTTKGKPVGGMYIMAAGRIEIVADDVPEREVGPGDFLFAPQVLSNGKAPHDSRAGSGGALVLFAGRGVAHELLLSVPPLLEIFAS